MSNNNAEPGESSGRSDAAPINVPLNNFVAELEVPSGRSNTMPTNVLVNNDMAELIATVAAAVIKQVNRKPVVLEYRPLLSDLIPEGKEKQAVPIGSWLEDTHLRLQEAEAPIESWVSIAAYKIPRDIYLRYPTWCEENKRSQADWASFKEYLLRTYAGVLSQFDTYLKWDSLATPINADELETYHRNFTDLANLLQVELNSAVTIFKYAKKLPAILFQRLFTDLNPESTLTIESVRAMASSHFRARALERSSSAMDTSAAITTGQDIAVDAMYRNGPRTSYNRGPPPPSYEEIKHLCNHSQATYWERRATRVCLGCGGRGHVYAGCRKTNPKGREE
ncbi:hypothetical protein LPJ62_006640 [Coemansia sp. RSA 2167]|nr:hypothetical protein LPJ62_006640 [Coemansia sp. RSA 2167]